MDSATPGQWIVGVFGVFVLGWLLRLQRGQGSMMTREEHNQICIQQQAALIKRLDSIDRKLEAQDKSAVEYREGVQESLGQLKTDVACINTTLGAGPPKRRGR